MGRRTAVTARTRRTVVSRAAASGRAVRPLCTQAEATPVPRSPGSAPVCPEEKMALLVALRHCRLGPLWSGRQGPGQPACQHLSCRAVVLAVVLGWPLLHRPGDRGVAGPGFPVPPGGERVQPTGALSRVLPAKPDTLICSLLCVSEALAA